MSKSTWNGLENGMRQFRIDNRVIRAAVPVALGMGLPECSCNGQINLISGGKMHRTYTATIAGLLLLILGQIGWQSAAYAQLGVIPSKSAPEIRQALLDGKIQEVIVEFDDTQVQSDASAMRRKATQQYETATVLNFKKNEYVKLKQATVAVMPDKDYELLLEYGQLPLTFIRLRSVAALDALQADSRVRKIHKNAVKYPVLDATSSGFVNQPAAAARGFTGAGGTVAVIDTGVNYTLSDFGSCTAPGVPAGCKVSYYANLAGSGGSLDANGHGTNVAGIIAGVASGAKIRALNVFGSGSNTSDALIIAAIDNTIAARATVNVVAINMSLGDGVNHGNGLGSDCEKSVFSAPIFNALQANIKVVAASGNDGFSTGINLPACTPGTTAVGAVYDSAFSSVSYSICSDSPANPDQIACFANLPPLTGTDTFNNSYNFVVAPGVNITAGGVTDSGTSQATPFATSALTLHNAAIPALSSAQTARGDQISNFLAVPCGSSIPVTRTGYPAMVTLVDVSACLSDANDNFANATSFGMLASNVTANGDNVFATKEPGEPSHAGNPGGHSVWFTFTPAMTSPIAIDTHLSGFPTLLAVYTGTSVSALTQVAANVTDGSAGNTSGLTFPAVAGTTYYVALDGYNGASGNWDLDVNILASNLSIVLTANPLASSPGSIQYVATVTDAGPAGATGVNVNISLPAGVTLDPNNSGGCTAGAGNVVTCPLGSISAAKGVASVTFNAIGSTTGVYTATASVTSAYVDPNGTSTASASATISEAQNVPTLPQWGMLLLGGLLFALMQYQARRGTANRG